MFQLPAAGQSRHDRPQIPRPGVAGGGVGGPPGHGAGPSRPRVDSGNALPRGRLRVRAGGLDVDRDEPDGTVFRFDYGRSLTRVVLVIPKTETKNLPMILQITSGQ